MKVSELGEFGLIDLLAKMADSTRNNQKASWQQLIIGIGDATAASFKKAASCPVTTIGEIVADKTGEITLVDKKRTIVGYNRY